MDFMHDQLADGRSIRLFNVIDDYKNGGTNGTQAIHDDAPGRLPGDQNAGAV